MRDDRPEFAEFSERTTPAESLLIKVRAAVLKDAADVARMESNRNHLDSDSVERSVRREFKAMVAGDTTRHCCVAQFQNESVGYGKAAFQNFQEVVGTRNLPTAWYLIGLVVTPAYRRRGVGLALTGFRLEHCRKAGATEAWFFSNAGNRASIALHERLGFEEVTRDFHLPGLTFTGGVGILFRKSL